MRIGLLLCVAACGFEHGALMTNVPSDSRTDDTGGDDAQMLDGSMPIDSDGDGHLDSADNCPAVPNTDQHDEDADSAGDACDPCPMIANATSDADSDGVADACDPHPATPGDSLAVFEPFSVDGGLPTTWTVASGAATDWRVANDALSADAGSTTLIILRNAGTMNHAIDVGFSLVTGSNSQSFVTPVVDTSANAQQFLACGIRIDTDYRQFLTFDNGTFASYGTDSTESLDVPGVYRVRTGVDATATCATPQDNGSDHTLTHAHTPFGNTYAGLRIVRVAVAIRYLAIYAF